MKSINFYRTGDPYGEFSNFFRSFIFLHGQTWPTVVHFFQAMKSTDPAVQKKIREQASPMDAAQLGRSRGLPLRSDWEEVKVDIMREGVRAKFFQIPHLKQVLMETGDALLIEHTVNDAFWGDGGDGSGKNQLGKLLMEVRSQLNEIDPTPNRILPPWIAFPGIDPQDLFWRMGVGENYLTQLWKELADNEAFQGYLSAFTLPSGWERIFDA